MIQLKTIVELTLSNNHSLKIYYSGKINTLTIVHDGAVTLVLWDHLRAILQ